MNKAKSIDPKPYGPCAAVAKAQTLGEERLALCNFSDEAVIAHALAILKDRVNTKPMLTSPDDVKAYLQLQLHGLGHEIFGVIFVDAQHRVITEDIMFRGTLTQTSVYPREVVKAALLHNAAAVMLYHNHPSGSAEPSRADEYLTTTLKQALNLVDVRILDHIVVGNTTVSFAERGLL